METEWMSAKETAEYLDLTVAVVHEFIRRGELPASQFGQRYRVRRVDLDAFIESCRIKPTRGGLP